MVYQLHPWVKCRDYLLDGLIWTRRPDLYTQKVYGFPRIDDVNDHEVELVVKGENNKLLSSIEVLREMEDELGIKRTILRKVAPKTWYIKGDPWWNKTTIHLSSYSVILRVLEHCDIQSWEALENSIQGSLSELRGNMRKVLLALKDSGYDVLFPVKDISDPMSIHNASGVYNFVYSLKYEFDLGMNYEGLKEAYAKY